MSSNVPDVAVVGGGPAGAAAAVTLARLGLQTIVIDATGSNRPHVGETLPPAVRPILQRLSPGLLERPGVSLASYGNQSSWGGPELESAAFIFEPYGRGLHVDRRRFDDALLEAAVAAGAQLLPGVRVRRAVPHEEGWQLELQRASVSNLTAAAVIDAGGRRAGLARSLGARRRVRDQLVGIAATFEGAHLAELPMLVEATCEGWWYSAPLPLGRAVVAFMTDTDLCREGRYAHPQSWSQALAATRYTRERLRSAAIASPVRVAWAATHRLERGDSMRRWLAAGDAAIAVDPLSGSGVLRALLTGEAAGMAIAHRLLGRTTPAEAYEQWLDRRFEEEWAARTAFYEMERRWRDYPFWHRRSLPTTRAAGRAAADKPSFDAHDAPRTLSSRAV